MVRSQVRMKLLAEANRLSRQLNWRMAILVDAGSEVDLHREQGVNDQLGLEFRFLFALVDTLKIGCSGEYTTTVLVIVVVLKFTLATVFYAAFVFK